MSAEPVRVIIVADGEATDVRLHGPCGWMTAFRGPPLGAENMARAFAQVLGVTVESAEQAARRIAGDYEPGAPGWNLAMGQADAIKRARSDHG